MALIIETNDGRFFRVTDATTYDHAFVAVPVKRTKVAFTDKAGASSRLIRRAGCRVVEGE